MSRRIDLPGGAWADLKDPDELTNRDRKLLRRRVNSATKVGDRLRALGVTADMAREGVSDALAAQVEAVLDSDAFDALSDAQGAFIVAYTAAWSLDRPLPTLDTVDDLPAPIFDALAEATSKLGADSEEVPEPAPA